jgi:probable selenium-dependent hydroxylase accessory protein YqeC
MELVDAIQPDDGHVCVVGAGGKTTTIFSLAARTNRALVTSTVHIPIFDRDVREVAVTSEPIERLAATDPESFPLGLVPERASSDRYRGYDPATVDRIADAHDGPVLVKGDGARMREFKAPGENEPRIPASADVVVPVASAHIVGKPLTGHWVHRPEQVASLVDADLGEKINPETVAAAIAHEEGGLKGVPSGATVVPLVTKVDGPGHERAAADIADRIHELTADATVEVPRVGLARFDVFETR